MLLQEVAAERARPLDILCAMPALIDGAIGRIRFVCHPGGHQKGRTNQRYPSTVIVVQMHRWATHPSGLDFFQWGVLRIPRSLPLPHPAEGVERLHAGFGMFYHQEGAGVISLPFRRSSHISPRVIIPHPIANPKFGRTGPHIITVFVSLGSPPQMVARILGFLWSA